VKIQPQWVVTPRKQTNKQTNILTGNKVCHHNFPLLSEKKKTNIHVGSHFLFVPDHQVSALSLLQNTDMSCHFRYPSSYQQHHLFSTHFEGKMDT
jgi:hypothetical protein